MRRPYEDAPEYPNAVTVKGYKGIAWYVRGWETVPDEDTEWTGIENRTGNLVVTMIGDDRHFIVEPTEVENLTRKQYCGECGQIGCCHDSLDRSENV